MTGEERSRSRTGTGTRTGRCLFDAGILGILLWLGSAGCQEEAESLLVIRARPSSPGQNGVQASFDSRGGTLTLPGRASVAIPPGALAEDTALAVGARDLDALAPLPGRLQKSSRAFSLLPVAQTFSKPVTLQIAYRIPDGTPRVHVLGLDDALDPSWEVLEGTATVGVARVATRRFGIYVVAHERALEVPDAAVPDGGGL